MTDHISLEVIAALGEGLLDPQEAGQARLHLRNCFTCAAREAELAEVPAALRRIAEAGPPPVPAWVAERLDAALAAETGSDGTAPAGASPDHVPSIADARRRRGGRDSRVLQPLAAAAVVCLFAGGGYALFRAIEQPPGAGSSAAASRPVASSVATPPKRGGPLAAPQASPSSVNVPQLVHSGINYQPAQLQAQVESMLRQTAGERHNGSSPGSPHGTELPAGLQGCVRRIIGAQQPTLVDEASYHGQPATVVVAPQPNGPGGQVWVAGPGCSAARSDVLARAPISSIP